MIVAIILRLVASVFPVRTRPRLTETFQKRPRTSAQSSSFSTQVRAFGRFTYGIRLGVSGAACELSQPRRFMRSPGRDSLAKG